jgi:hypothetical protein
MTKLVGSGSDEGNEADEQVPVRVLIVGVVVPNLVHAFTLRLAAFGRDAISAATTARI